MNRNRLHRPTIAAVVIAGCLAAPTSALADGVDAGTLIENIAQATYDAGGGQRTVRSNTVSVRVDELLDVTVTSLDAGALDAAPGEAVLSFEVTNTGNGPETFELLVNPSVTGNDFEVATNALAIDTNGNGTFDPGVDEELSGALTTPELAAREALTVFVLVTVPDDVADAEESAVELIASAATGTGAPGTVFAGAGAGGGNAVVGATGASASARGGLTVGIASVELIKAVTISDPFGGTSAVPGSVATFTITASVSGSGAVDTLLVTDVIPEGTSYAPETLALDGAGLSDAADADAGSASDAGGISVELGTVAAGTSHAISFDVVIESSN